VISPDAPDTLAGYWQRSGLTLTALLDPKLEAATAFGVRNEAVNRVPHPTAVVVDRDGIVRYARTDVTYIRRPPVAELLAAVRALAPATR